MREFLKFFIKNILKNDFTDGITLKDAPLVNILVIKKIDYKRYELMINKKKLICISHKNLETLKYYWGNISQDNNKIITLSNLQKIPEILQNDNFTFFNIKIDTIADIIDVDDCKQKFLKFLNTKKNLFLYNNFIYLLNKNIITIPFIIDNEKIFSQFKIIQNKHLNKKIVIYYFAFKNFGPFEGSFEEKNGKIKIFTGYKNNLKKIDTQFDDFDFNIKNQIKPMREIGNFVLDIKG